MKSALLLALFLIPGFISAQTNEPANAEEQKVDVKDLLKLPAFTNSSGVVMVRVSPKLWASKYLITQADFKLIMGSNPSKFQGDQNPVDSVSWNQAMEFCAKLTEAEKKAEMLPSGAAYTLPTQAQWEMLGAGTSIEQAATSQKQTRTSTAPAGSTLPNKLGLFDTRGNLWQFCLDPQDKPFRVLRGGAWNTSIEVNLRPEFRWYSTGPDDGRDIYGFRCVMQL